LFDTLSAMLSKDFSGVAYVRGIWGLKMVLCVLSDPPGGWGAACSPFYGTPQRTRLYALVHV